MTTTVNDVASGVIEIAAGTSAADIQSIINAAPEGATIQLAAGSYYFTSTVEVTRSDISIVGAGQGQTVITLGACMNGAPAFQIGSALFAETMSTRMEVANDISAGDNTITLASGSVSVGDVLWIEAENTDELFAAIGDTLWQKDKPLRTAMVIVTAVDGNVVTLSDSIDFDMPAEITTVQVIEVVDNVTLSGMTLQGDFGTADPSSFTNAIASEDDGMMVLVNATTNVVISDLELLDMGSNGLVLGRSIAPDVDDIYISGAHNKGNDGNGYGIWIRDVYNGTFDGLEIYDTRHAVLFASYTSASGNVVHVIETNRDINFHGGLDVDNTVIVDNSIREGAEQGYLGTVVFFNDGASYGAPTDADANTVLFTNVLGTVRADAVHASDEVWGGAGSDYIELGSGTDRVHASGGYDIIVGGSGTDTLVVDGNAGCGLVYNEDGQVVVLNNGAMTVLDSVEYIEYEDMTIETATAGGRCSTYSGGEGYDRAYVLADAIMGADLEAVTTRNVGAIDVMGNALNNNVIGNNYNNQIYLRGGNDRTYGGRGDDYMDGGTGNDYLAGGSGDDTLVGGDGDDVLVGRHGADTFVASGGTNVVDDFHYRQGDQLVFGDMQMDDVLAAILDSYQHGNSGAITYTQTTNGLLLTDAEAHSLTLAGLTALELLDQYGLV